MSEFKAYLTATATVLLTLLLSFWLDAYLPTASLLLLFLACIVFVSANSSLGASLFASLLSFFSFNFWFTQPRLTLDITHSHDVAMLLLFMAISITIANLAARMRRAIIKQKQTVKQLDHFFAFSQKMTVAIHADEVIDQLRQTLDKLIEPPLRYIDHRDTAADDAIHPLSADAQQQFSLSVENLNLASFISDRALTKKDTENIQTFCNLAALALQRMFLVKDLEQTRMASETEQLRSALLSSISHDLRTPLSSVIGSASSLLAYRSHITENDHTRLLQLILDESQRLDRHIQNLLDMTRFGQGKVTLKRDWVDVNDIISGALHRLADVLSQISVTIQCQNDIPIIWVHGLLIEQALVNILDNAARVTPANGSIEIAVNMSSEWLQITIADNGPGIADAQKEQVFDMFFSVQHADSETKTGTGLGLAISKAMIVSHGGTITIKDNQPQGTIMCVALPKNVIINGPDYDG